MQKFTAGKFHSITSSANTSGLSKTFWPNALVALNLITQAKN